jgi:hypothetical protein
LTGSIGSGNPLTREALALKISSLKLPILSIKTDEELQMARKARAAGLL